MPDPATPEVAAIVLAYVADSAPVLSFRLDSELRVCDANHYARQIVGYAVEGRDFTGLLPDFIARPDIRQLATTPEMVRLITLSTVSGMLESFGFRFFALGDGSVLALGSPDWAEHTRIQSAALELNRELNIRKRQLHQANAELRELVRLKTKFLGMAAHDLRRPIGVILTHIQFVLDEARADLSSEHQGFLRTSLNATAAMKQMIDDFLDLAVLESGKLQLDLAPASAAEIVAGALLTARLSASRKQVELLVDVTDATPPAKVDAPKLQQVLLNLIDNAVEHSQPGQRVWLNVQREPQRLVFAVRDEGAGLALEQQPRLFEAFEREGMRKTGGGRHAGLGLAIARMVVEAHGGRIWVASEPGAGATFAFSIPAAESWTQAGHRGDAITDRS